MADFLTRPRAGAPATVDLMPAQWELWLAPVGLAYVAPLLALMEEKTLSVADLCAAPPPAEERWTINDVIASLIPGDQDVMRAKLDRMAAAQLWPTYCEFYPSPTQDGGVFDGTPKFLWNDGFGWAVAGSNPPQSITYGNANREVTSGPMTVDDVWFYTLWKRCLVAPTDQNVPQLHHFNASNGNVANIFTGSWPTTAGVETWSLILPQNMSMSACAPPHRWGMTAASSGTWLYTLTAWTRALPPQPEPWALAPAVPTPYQFTDECAEALCAMAASWPPEPLPDESVPVNVTTGPTSTLHGGGQVLDVPTGAVGAVLELVIGSLLSNAGSSPTVFWSAGYVACGSELGWRPSQRLKHDSNLLYPLPPLTTRIGVDLEPSVTGTVSWLVEAAPE